MKSALLRLREYRDSISPTERTIADYLLDHPESAMECGVHELAERTFSSASTIIRMCRRIGFDGYKDFRRAVTYEAALRRHNEEERKEITFSDSMEEIIEKITEKNIVSLEDTRNLLDPKSLERCVEIICRSRNVLLFGLGASLLAARDLYLKYLEVSAAEQGLRHQRGLARPAAHGPQRHRRGRGAGVLLLRGDGGGAHVHAGPQGEPHAGHRHHPIQRLPGGGAGGPQHLHSGQRVHLPVRGHVLPPVPAQRGGHPLHRLRQQGL